MSACCVSVSLNIFSLLLSFHFCVCFLWQFGERATANTSSIYNTLQNDRWMMIAKTVYIISVRDTCHFHRHSADNNRAKKKQQQKSYQKNKSINWPISKQITIFIFLILSMRVFTFNETSSIQTSTKSLHTLKNI